MSANYTVKKLSEGFTNHQPVIYERVGQIYDVYQREGITEADLKRLKRFLPDWQTINQEMEHLVKAGLVVRDDGRYRLNVRMISQNELQQLKAQGVTFAKEVLGKLAAELPLVSQAPWLLILAISELVQQWETSILLPSEGLPAYEISCAESEHFLFVEWGLESQTGLASYFQQGRETPKRNVALSFIGDVSPAFFLEMTGQVLTTLAKGERLKGIEENIFVKGLAHFDYLQLNDQQAEVFIPIETTSEASFTKELEALKTFLQINLVSDELLNYLMFGELLKELAENKYVLSLTKD